MVPAILINLKVREKNALFGGKGNFEQHGPVIRSIGVATALHMPKSQDRGVFLLDAWLARFGLGTPAVLDWIVSGKTARLVTSTIPGVPRATSARPN